MRDEYKQLGANRQSSPACFAVLHLSFSALLLPRFSIFHSVANLQMQTKQIKRLMGISENVFGSTTLCVALLFQIDYLERFP